LAPPGWMTRADFSTSLCFCVPIHLNVRMLLSGSDHQSRGAAVLTGRMVQQDRLPMGARLGAL
jgi:hypothetical protein